MVARGGNMKFAGFLPLVVAVASSYSFGQSAAVFTSPARIDTARCPVELKVEQAGSLTQNKVTYGTQGDVLPSIPDQRIRIILTNPLAHKIVSASITAHGFSRKGRFVPLSGAPGGPDMAKTVDLSLKLEGSSQASSELLLTHFTAVAVVDLNSVTYADGEVWRAPSSGACRATPDLFMRVAALP